MQTIMSNLSNRKAQYMAHHLTRNHYSATVHKIEDSMWDEAFIETNAPERTLNNASQLYDNKFLNV